MGGLRREEFKTTVSVFPQPEDPAAERPDINDGADEVKGFAIVLFEESKEPRCLTAPCAEGTSEIHPVR